MDHEVVQLQQRLNEVGQALTVEHNRLDEARRAGDAAEQHAKDVRARVQREAKRVAEMAAAAVLAAAAGGVDTGEFPRVVLAGADRTADSVAQPHVVNPVPIPRTPTSDRSSHARHDTENAVAAQRGPQPAKRPGDAE
jgi:cell division septum initiation protein DivIVA